MDGLNRGRGLCPQKCSRLLLKPCDDPPSPMIEASDDPPALAVVLLQSGS